MSGSLFEVGGAVVFAKLSTVHYGCWLITVDISIQMTSQLKSDHFHVSVYAFCISIS